VSDIVRSGERSIIRIETPVVRAAIVRRNRTEMITTSFRDNPGRCYPDAYDLLRFEVTEALDNLSQTMRMGVHNRAQANLDTWRRQQ
jgi:hypothetical protein